MSLKLTFPTTALDGRVHREEELTLARTASQRQHAANPPVPETPDGAVAFHAMDGSPAAPLNPNRRRVALPDPRIFQLLEGEPSVTVAERRRVLPGYELYLVEQWACSRESLTFVIVTYTGDPQHSVTVGILEVPAEEKDWSPRLRLCFKAIQQYHARPKETGIGELMVTNLSSFPSALTVIAVPEGDIRKYRQVFVVNENLKRLGCSGRSGLTLTDPTPATRAKFMQLYKISESIPFVQAVLELVTVCQLALHIFGMLDEEYIDGLLCDVTEKAINDWWIEIGSEYFNIEPSDGILGPTTVAALLGTLLGARNRLSSYGAPVSKDVFDLESTKKGIGTFQKSLKLERTRRLNRQTLLKLHSMTAKAAAGEGGWGVQKAVKSTVAGVGGKRGELVIGMVSGRDKANIGDIETLDLAKFINLAYGERPKWLWHGKPRRTLHGREDEHPVPTIGKDLKGETGPQRRIQSAPVEDELEAKKREDSPVIYSSPKHANSAPPAAEVPFDKDLLLRKTVFKSVAGKVSDARSGLGRIRDAVGGGLRGHVSRPSKDESPDTGLSGHTSPSIATLAHSSAALTSPVAVGRAFPWKEKSEDSALKDREGSKSVSAITSSSMHGTETQAVNRAEEKQGLTQAEFTEIAKEIRSTNVSAPGSVVTDGDLRGPVLAAERGSDNALLSLQRRHSIDSLASLSRRHNEARYPRRLSFSVAEDAVLCWNEIISITDTADSASATVLQSQAELAYYLYSQLQLMQTDLAPWAARKLASVERLDETFGAQQAELQALYAAARETYERIRHSSSGMVTEERTRLAEAVKDVEVLVAKLEYEIGALVSRVNEVEDGVVQLEAQVEDVERRADELKTVLETESWLHWFVRTVTGIGTGPNITRGPTQREARAVQGKT
ncbi:Sin3 complex subunit [Madurella fahalii]|uniref:Sin3 complex subunit n=1 Tax=Madurella fahalii TaxID=1157608 RepID=A0ABQ0FWZ8_9PEZI